MIRRCLRRRYRGTARDLQQHPAVPLPLAQRVHHLVAGDRDQPAAERTAAAIEAAPALPGRHEDLLGHVLGVGPGAQGAQRDAVDQRPEPLVDKRERVRLPATEGSCDILIRQPVHQNNTKRH